MKVEARLDHEPVDTSDLSSALWMVSATQLWRWRMFLMGMLAPLHPGPADLVWRTVHKLCSEFKKIRFPEASNLVICEQFLVFDVMF